MTSMNRLAGETSPYLRQHMHNPVDWYPWGEEAFEKARTEGKPILISIGYSACHWCHVMERECFENPEIARQINETVVAIKVDREERPDVDSIYMAACLAMNGHGGWPLNAFTTPTLQPFFVGTYFPPASRGGMPGFPDILARIREVWALERLAITEQARQLYNYFNESQQAAPPEIVPPDTLRRAVTDHERTFDAQRGGFGNAPKFPPDTRLSLLLAASAVVPSESASIMALRTLEAMAMGGIYDHVGGGFARYSVDAEWLIPHFEKMLYNQALLLPPYLEAWQLTGRALFRRAAEHTLDWCLRDLTSETGAFYSAYDADSEGVEGKYYVWTPAEVTAALGAEDGAQFCAWFDITHSGNFEHGTSQPRLLKTPETLAQESGLSEDALYARMDDLLGRLRAVRATRVAPGLDDKVLTGWNGLLITALARAAQVLGEDRFAAAARNAADAILTTMVDEADGTLYRVLCKGRRRVAGLLEDYSYFAQGLFDLFELTQERRYLDASLRLSEAAIAMFGDPASGGFFIARSDDASLITRPRDDQDGAMPASGNVLASTLARLARATGREDLAERARETVRGDGARANKFPAAFASLLLAQRQLADDVPEIVIHGGGDEVAAAELLSAARAPYLPARLVLRADRPELADLPLCEGRTSAAQPTAWVCRGRVCQAPVHSAAALREALATKVVS